MGLVVAFFLFAFCVSGVILNHRNVFSRKDVPRQWLPSRYHYKQWNNGALRGSMLLGSGTDSILLYGATGLWLSHGGRIEDFNQGLPPYSDYRAVRSVVQASGGVLFALTPYQLFWMRGQSWQVVMLPLDDDERLTDVSMQGDSLVVFSRSRVFISQPPYQHFTSHWLRGVPRRPPRVSLFRTVWTLHSGEAYGWVGRFLVDGVAVLFVLLTVTGLLCFLLPRWVRSRRRRGHRVKVATRSLQRSSVWHRRMGSTFLLALLFVTITGWFLRPPLLLSLVPFRVPALPWSTLQSAHPWHEGLRMARYDTRTRQWLVSTSDGFFAFRTLTAEAQPLEVAPPVSVMGVNVWEPMGNSGKWLVGSFSGLYVWDVARQTVTDYFTHRPAPRKAGPPFGQKPIAGLCLLPQGQCVVVDYIAGTPLLPQPATLSRQSISLWNLALEVHTGRLFFGTSATYFYVFLFGALLLWVLLSGWKMMKRRR